MRDYVFAEDCGDLVSAGLIGLRQFVAREGTPVVVKIVASGQGVTIAALLSESARLYKKRPRVVVKAPVEGSGQVPDLRLRSLVWADLDEYLRCSLTVGMSRTAADIGQRTRMSQVR
jgi:UDP-glucose 4-epimerase